MTLATADLDRPASRRFVRNLALSLSGGAILTVLGAGAGVASADDGTAGTSSQGAGAAQSGDATAVGNRSGTQKNQTASTSGALGNVQVIDQTAAVANVGVAVADTGNNRAVGNQSVNTADTDQTALNALGGATNSGTAANSSNGTALISTGHASAFGNQSNTTINQSANGSAHGGLGGILVVTQTGAVLNAGVAQATTGGNDAEGNSSDNEVGLLQTANATAGLASNSGKSQNTSDGLATISTGNSSAVGNQSDTKVTQSTQGSAGGPDPGGLQLLNQLGFVVNAGIATANSGGNEADGNESHNDDDEQINQNIGVDSAPPEGPVGVASNTADASNWSNGTGQIWTGPTSAVGNQSTTELSQSSDSEVHGLGASIVPQAALVLNVGIAQADSGNNEADGNESNNEADVDQDIPESAGTDVGVAANFAQTENISDGTATIRTGAAVAGGNRSKTNVSQNVKSHGDDFNLQPQLAVVANIGVGQANSGNNDASGNESDNDAAIDDQEAILTDDDGIDLGVVGQFGKASNNSGGNAAVYTGNAVAQGNDSETDLSQEIDPSGLVLNPQLGIVINAGLGSANTGNNLANGNTSDNDADVDQLIEVGQDNNTTIVVAGTIVESNNAEASNTSDGSAEVVTGAANATGNVSRTGLSQTTNGGIDGMGLVLNTQVGVVANVGVGVATTGDNTATGNRSDNDADVEQDVHILSDNNADASLGAGIVVGSNNGTASNASDGTAKVQTGRASAAGNRSETDLIQEADGRIDGLGVVLNTQVGVVGNLGLAVANTGDNDADGNESNNEADLDQSAEIASDNDIDGQDLDVTVIGTATAANSGSAENSSDGTADIRSGNAMAVGNASATELKQTAAGHAPGLVLNTQVAAIANAGVGIAQTGDNTANGNDSDNAGNEGAELDQDAEILEGNEGDHDLSLFVVGPVTAANNGTASNTSDGTGRIRTGDAQAQGNVSSTFMWQDTDSNVGGLGGVISTQVAGVANLGLAVANTGDNFAEGNDSENDAELVQRAEIGTDNDLDDVGDDLAINVIGPLTASNSADASSTSDGTASIGTGSALATGNASATNVSQSATGEVRSLGMTVGTQAGGVANVGAGIANTGQNEATGNESENDIDEVGGGADGAIQDADILDNADEGDALEPSYTFLGPVTASNSATAANTSDGDACVCTGNAVASGNVSSTTLIQDMDLSTTSGFVILTEAGGVGNAGIGLANTGQNGAIGNSSENDAEVDQFTNIDDALLTPVDGPQTSANTLNIANTSKGSGHVGSGNASGTGNQSTTDFVQAAAIDSSFAASNLVGGTANAGLGLANTGLNDAIGNDSTNAVILDQSADGSGLVANQGDATNDSDGTAIIGDPQCCDDEDVPPGEEKPGLPRTGAELQVEALMGLAFLLAGYGLRRRSRQLAEA